MNYHRVQTQFILLFIAIVAMTFSAIPFIDSATVDLSDAYAKSKMATIQGEMFFYQQSKGSFYQACSEGSISIVVGELIEEYGKRITCETEPPRFQQMMVCTQLRSDFHYCVDGEGVSCESREIPPRVHSCKQAAEFNALR